MRAIDSNLLVYAALVNHPAMTVCEQCITRYPNWMTSIVNLVELGRVLVAVYGVSENDADAKFTDLCQALVVEQLTAATATVALSLRQTYGVDFNDAVLLESCRQRRVKVLATDDLQLRKACRAMGIHVENPVTPAVRAQMANWESQNLPAKGLTRILSRVHGWIDQHDAALARTFHSATQSLSALV